MTIRSRFQFIDKKKRICLRHLKTAGRCRNVIYHISSQDANECSLRLCPGTRDNSMTRDVESKSGVVMRIDPHYISLACCNNLWSLTACHSPISCDARKYFLILSAVM
ncbi:uncharacterized protein LOC105424508 isoform X1 [Pogonomyrmex barbatus]|uniref:Uncharacterized protein LOC105424508 isoform X1 n=1 Tax=Pogonomyrmex barbatus TaxID=144034 RepID=A0A8N1S3X3_9HYME|nr:uncharacterized protein LOC105424508 isoform X1 [Pogonomyrmex barbatus]